MSLVAPDRAVGRPIRLVLGALVVTLVATTGCIGSDSPPETAPSSTVATAASDNGSAARASAQASVIHDAGSHGSPGTEFEGGQPPTVTARYTGSEAFEPTIGVTPNRTLFVEGLVSKGFPEEDHLEDQALLRSQDAGRTWTDVTPKVASTNVTVGFASLDPYVHVDPTTGRVFQLDLQATTCSSLSFSDDGGRSWTTNPVGCGLPPGAQDHPTLFTGPAGDTPTLGYSNLVHYCVNRLADAACARSLDGGRTFGPLTPLVFQGARTEAPGTVPDVCYGLTGHGSTGPDGTVYLARACQDTVQVAVSEDRGVTFERETIDADHGATGHEVAVTTDAAGNAYAFWIEGDTRQPRLAHSTDRGETWSNPVDVSAPSVETASFPSIAAGAPGRVVLTYYGTNATSPETNETPLLSDEERSTDVPGNATWNAYLSVTLEATRPHSTLATAPVTPRSDPIAKGPCDASNRCESTGLGEVGDFVDVTIGPDGRPWAALVDVCEAACRNGTASDTARGLVATLATGPSLVGGELDPLTGDRRSVP